MKDWMNLYTFLIDHVATSYCYGDKVRREIRHGFIKVNGEKPDDINMKLNIGDIVTVNFADYQVKQEHMI